MKRHPVQIADLQTVIKLGEWVVSRMKPNDMIAVDGRLVTAVDVEAETLRAMDALARETEKRKVTASQPSQ